MQRKADTDSLVTRLKGGDRSAAAELVDTYYGSIYLFMRRLGSSQHVSEDLTQEVFLHAWEHLGQLRSGKALNSWLYRIAGNVLRLHNRKYKHTRLGRVAQSRVASDNEARSYEVTGPSEPLQRLHNLVLRLPMKLRETVVLHYMQQLTIAEAAEAAGIRQGTFKSRLNRALTALREEFIQNG